MLDHRMENMDLYVDCGSYITCGLLTGVVVTSSFTVPIICTFNHKYQMAIDKQPHK